MVQLPFDDATLTLCEVEVYVFPIHYTNVTSSILPSNISLDLSAVNDGLVETCTVLGNQTWSADGLLWLGDADERFPNVSYRIHASGINFHWLR